MWTKVMILKDTKGREMSNSDTANSMVGTWNPLGQVQDATGSPTPVNTGVPETRRAKWRSKDVELKDGGLDVFLLDASH